MKKVLLLLTFFLLSFGVWAQDNALLDRILEVNSSAKSFESDLRNTLQKPNKSTVQLGKLYFVKPDQFAALFDTGGHMIVNKDRLKMDIGLFHGKFKLKDSGMMRSLSNIFLYGFQGRCKELAEDNDYSLEIKEVGVYQQVTFTTKKRSFLGVGYKQVIFNFEKESLKLKEIILIDNRDVIDTYTISDTQYNVPIATNKFDF